MSDPLRRSLRLLPLLVLAGTLGVPALFAQFGPPSMRLPMQSPRPQIAAGLGYSNVSTTAIGGCQGDFMTLNLEPEVPVGPVDVGLLITARLNVNEPSFCQEDFDDVNDFLGMLRYARIGQKFNRGLYARAGYLEDAEIGYGQQVAFYKNEVSPDYRQLGLAADYDANILGVETLFGTLSDPGVYAVRAFTRPLNLRPGTSQAMRYATLGVTVSGDLNDDGAFVRPDSAGRPFALPGTPGALPLGVPDDALTIVGADLAIPVRSDSMTILTPYLDVAHIVGYGTGFAPGFAATFRTNGALNRLDTRVETRFTGKQYLPGYFNALYERERLQRVVVGADTLFLTKRNRLAGIDQTDIGLLGAVRATVFKNFRFGASYQQLFRTEDSGWLRLSSNITIPKVLLGSINWRINYDRLNIDRVSEFFALDDNTLLDTELSYTIWWVRVGVRYDQRYAPLRDPVTTDVVGYEKQESVQTKASLVVRL